MTLIVLSLTPSIKAQEYDTHIVSDGETLYEIALTYQTTIEELAVINELEAPYAIQENQELLVPILQSLPTLTAITPTPTTTSSNTLGIEVFYPVDDLNQLIEQLAFLRVEWVKLTIQWQWHESEQGQFDFATLDPLIEALTENNLNILATITGTPAWARPSASPEQLKENSPPDKFGDLVAFTTELVTRYTGNIAAYEIWTQPNLRREWNSAIYPIGAEYYLDLVDVVASEIRAVDSAVTIISAGLAPTGFNDGFNAVDDFLFMETLIENNISEIVDAIGIHPYGWANSPEARCCSNGSNTMNEDNPHFYFVDTIQTYHDMLTYRDLTIPMWITRLGWGTSEGTPITTINSETSYWEQTNSQEQASYVVDALQFVDEYPLIEATIVYNLNGCIATDTRACAYSIIADDDFARPLARALAQR